MEHKSEIISRKLLLNGNEILLNGYMNSYYQNS